MPKSLTQKKYTILSAQILSGILRDDRHYLKDGLNKGYLKYDEPLNKWILHNVNVEDIVSLSNIDNKSITIEIKESKINHLKLKDSSFLGILFVDSIINEIIIANSHIRNLQIFNNAEINNLAIDKYNTIENIELGRSSKVKKLTIEDSNVKRINIIYKSLIFDFAIKKLNVEEIKIYSSVVQNLNVDSLKINHFNILNSSKIGNFRKDGGLYTSIVKNSKIESLIISGKSKVSILALENTTISLFEVESNSDIKKFNIHNNSKINNYNIRDATIHLIAINESEVNNFFISENSKISRIQLEISAIHVFYIQDSKLDDISLVNSKTEYLNLKNCHIFCDLYFNKTAIGSSIIQSSIFGDYKITSSNVKNIKIIDSLGGNVEANILQEDTKFNIINLSVEHSSLESLNGNGYDFNNIYLKESIFENISLDKITVKKKFHLLEKSKVWKLWINGKEIRNIVLQDSYLQNLEWNQDSICMFNVENCEIETFLFKQTSIPKDSVFQISDTYVNQLNFSIFVNTAWLNISNLKPLVNYNRFIELGDTDNEKVPKKLSKLKIENNREIFLFETVENKESSIYLLNSDMGKTSFVDSKLDEFDEFIYYNTKMLEVYVGGTKMPTEVRIPSAVNLNEEKEQKRLAFGQFKKIYDNRGDNVTATEFLALELEAYAEELKEKKKNKQNEVKWSEQFNLWLNDFSSNYGNDWWKAVKVTIGINSFLFLWYCMIIGHSYGTNVGLFFKLCAYSLEFLNPLRKAGFLESPFQISEAREGLLILWDYFSRIVIAYFVYQTIQAFRRFGRR